MGNTLNQKYRIIWRHVFEKMMYRIYISGTSFPDVTIYSGKDWQRGGEMTH